MTANNNQPANAAAANSGTADEYTATYTNSGAQFEPAPEGPQQVVCVDGIYLGHTVEQYQNNPPRLVEKYALVFQTADVLPATGKRAEVSKEFTISMHEKAGLRKFLAAWRGKAYTDEEARRVPLHKVVGFNGLATVEHKVSRNGRTYAVITNIAPLMRNMARVEAVDYQRAPYWDERKNDYKAKAAAYIEAQNRAAAKEESAAGGDGSYQDDSDLPF